MDTRGIERQTLDEVSFAFLRLALSRSSTPLKRQNAAYVPSDGEAIASVDAMASPSHFRG